MIHCVSADNAYRYAEPLEQMFHWRYEVFVKTRGWTDLRHDGAIERDQFDTGEAVYLLSLRPDGALSGSLRLLATDQPHLLSEVFPHLAPDGVPRGPDIYEMTRYFTIRDREQPEQMRRTAGELLCGMFEYCLHYGGRSITTAFDTFFLRRMRQNKWNEKVLGPSISYGEGKAVAIQIPVSYQNLEATRAAHGIAGPVLRLPEILPDVSVAAA